jgi:drug/metabolite transporter (DMT)-like permease
MAVFSTALAHILSFRVLATAGAVTLSVVTFLVPVSATFLGSLVLGERLAPKHLVGMALNGWGLARIDGRF